jgi:hypothetical protein
VPEPPPEPDGGGGGGLWPGPPALAIVGSTIAAKSTAEIVIIFEVFIALSKGYDPPKSDAIRIFHLSPLLTMVDS